jgi:hypothetical protein
LQMDKTPRMVIPSNPAASLPGERFLQNQDLDWGIH